MTNHATTTQLGPVSDLELGLTSPPPLETYTPHLGPSARLNGTPR